VPVLLAFTFFMGLMLSRLVGVVLGLANGASLIMMAFAGTGAIFFGMASLSTVIKRDLGSMGKFLFIGAIMLLVAGIANFFIQSSALMITLSVLAIGIFSAFILYDLKRVQDGGETNYITATLGVYLSIYNVFQQPAGAAGHLRRRARLSWHLRTRRGPAGPLFHPARFQPRSNTAMLSTCAVCGNMFTTPASAAVAGLVHQQAGIARQRGRVAADVDDAPRRRPASRRCCVQVGQGLGQREGAFARRVDQPAVGRAQRTQVVGRQLEQVARLEARLAPPAVERARCRARAATSVSLPSMPSTWRARVASGSVKLPRPQNQSITRSPAAAPAGAPHAPPARG
jgi:hypothetical protein